MEIITPPSRSWSGRFTCGRCKTEILANEDDLQLEGFKTSGYHFAGTAVIEDKFFVECPTDNQCLWVKEKEIPVAIRDELQKKLQEMRKR